MKLYLKNGFAPVAASVSSWLARYELEFIASFVGCRPGTGCGLALRPRRFGAIGAIDRHLSGNPAFAIAVNQHQTLFDSPAAIWIVPAYAFWSNCIAHR